MKTGPRCPDARVTSILSCEGCSLVPLCLLALHPTELYLVVTPYPQLQTTQLLCGPHGY